MSRLGAQLALVLAFPCTSAAQDAAAWRDSAYRLTAEIKRVRDSVQRADESIAEIARRGGLVVSASVKYQPIAVAALERFDSTRRRWFGEALPGGDGFRIVLRTGEPWRWRRPIESRQSISIAGLPDTGTATRFSPLVSSRVLSSPERAAHEMLSHFGNMMVGSAAASIRRWLPAGPSLILPDIDRREQAMYALVTGDGNAQRACVMGDLDACAYVLGLREPLTADPGGQYYPLARADLLLFALDQGGPGAWERLRNGPGASVEELLAAAADMPVDSLLSRWRQGLLAMRPDRGPISGITTLAFLAWSSVVLAASLGIAKWA